MADKTRTMEVEIKAKDKTKAGTKAAENNFDKLAASVARLGPAAAAATLAMGAVVTAKAVSLWAAQEKAMIQVEKRLKSTGASAWTSAKQLQAAAAGLQKITVFGDETILQMQSLLLTFKSIQGPIFQRATSSILDMASALAQSTGGEPDLRSAATMVGKALEDPVLGLTAMSRAGIQFNEEQKNLIKTLVETGEKAKAQGIILKELEAQFGGAAGAEGLTDATIQAKNAFGDLLESFGKGVAVGGELEKTMKDLTETFADPETQRALEQLGADLGFVAAKLIEIESVGASIAKNNPITLLYKGIGKLIGAGENIGRGLAGSPLEQSNTAGLDAFFGSGMTAGTGGGATAGGTGGAEVTGGGDFTALESFYGYDPETADIVWQLEQERINERWELKKSIEEQLTEMKHDELMERGEALDMFYGADLDAFILTEEQKTAAAERENRLRRRMVSTNLSASKSFFRSMGAFSEAGSKKAFEANKKGAQASAAVDTAQAVVSSFKNGGGYPWGLIPAGLMLIAGAAQQRKISQTQWSGSGTSTGSVGVGGGGGIQTPSSSQPVEQPATGSSAADLGVSYNISVYGNIVDHDSFARELINPLEKARLDGERPTI